MESLSLCIIYKGTILSYNTDNNAAAQNIRHNTYKNNAIAKAKFGVYCIKNYHKKMECKMITYISLNLKITSQTRKTGTQESLHCKNKYTQT